MKTTIIAALGFVTCLALAFSSVFAGGCNVGPKEGDSCNGLVQEDECIENTTCQTIGSCSQTYCCPSDPSTSTDPHCNGALCPPVEVDGGDDDGGSD